jgi:hypothetical protein
MVTDYLYKSTYGTRHKTERVTSNCEVLYDEAFSPGDTVFMDTIGTVRNRCNRQLTNQ